MSTIETHEFECVGRPCGCNPQLCQGGMQCWNRAKWTDHRGERVYCGRHLRGVFGAKLIG